MRFRVLACCRVGKRGLFAKTLMTSGGPQLEPPRAPVLEGSESSLRLPKLVQQGNRPKGQPKWTGVFGLGLRGSLESSLRLPKLAQRAEDTKWNPTLSDLTY